MIDSTDNLTPGPIPDPIPEPILLAYCDGELDAAQTTDVDARVADDTVLAARVEYERELARRVRAAMSVDSSIGLPVGLADRVRGALAEAEVSATAETAGEVGVTAAASFETPGETREPAPIPPGASRDRSGRNWFGWLAAPPRANAYAVAASLAVVAGAVLFGIFGQPIDAPREAGSLVAEIAEFVSVQHQRCAQVVGHRDSKLGWRGPGSRQQLTAHLHTPVPILDLRPLGYRFVGAASEELPGGEPSAHLVYARSAPGEDGCPEALLSLFVMPNHGQLDADPRFSSRIWEWTRAGERPDCTKRVACSTDGTLVYFLVCCDESRMVQLADRIGSAGLGTLRRP